MDRWESLMLSVVQLVNTEHVVFTFSIVLVDVENGNLNDVKGHVL